MKKRIFISSVQREFASERRELAEYIRKDAILGKFFEVFIFEEVPAQDRSASGVYLDEVDACDIYLGLHGSSYGNVDEKGVSATEREYERAEKSQKTRICFLKQGGSSDPRQSAFIARINADVVRTSFSNYDELRVGVYAALAKYLESKDMLHALPFDASYTAGLQLSDLSAASVQVMLFKDRLEIWNPAELPKGMTIAKLYKAHKSYPTNPFLARAMFLRKYIEETGTGAKDMIERCAEYGLPKPRWSLEDGDDFRVVILRPHSGAVSNKVPVNDAVNEAVKSLYECIKLNPGLNGRKLAMALSRSEPTIDRQVKVLKKVGLVEFRGAPKNGGYYCIHLHLPPTPNLP